MTNRERDRETYESMFYRRKLAGKFIGQINGFPQTTKIAQSNYPDIIQHGDAFAVREKEVLIL